MNGQNEYQKCAWGFLLLFSFHNSAKTFALHGKILVPYVWRDSQNFLLEINALRETFRKKLCHWQLFTIRKQLKDKVWKTPMPFFYSSSNSWGEITRGERLTQASRYLSSSKVVNCIQYEKNQWTRLLRADWAQTKQQNLDFNHLQILKGLRCYLRQSLASTIVR